MPLGLVLERDLCCCRFGNLKKKLGFRNRNLLSAQCVFFFFFWWTGVCSSSRSMWAFRVCLIFIYYNTALTSCKEHATGISTGTWFMLQICACFNSFVGFRNRIPPVSDVFPSWLERVCSSSMPVSGHRSVSRSATTLWGRTFPGLCCFSYLVIPLLYANRVCSSI